MNKNTKQLSVSRYGKNGIPAPAMVAVFMALLSAPVGQAANIAPEGTAIIGENNLVDTDAGTLGGNAANMNDNNLLSRVDNYGDSVLNVSFAGILWSTPRTDAVKSLVLTMATFYDGGWFGAPGTGPSPGGGLTASHLTPQPVVQTTTDGGVTWQSVAFTSDYLAAFTGHHVGGGTVPNPSSKAATFTLTTPVSGINGIRIIGENGGSADGNGFIGVFELEVNNLPANDTDGDGMDDAWEIANGTNPNVNDAAADPDGDGLTNIREYDAHTNPQDADSDHDGLNDGPEVLTYHSNPLAADSDADGLTDGEEVNTYTTNPILTDTDGDGLTDGAEVLNYGTSPILADTDGDTFNDKIEIEEGTDPKSNTSFPSNIARLGTAIIGTNNAIDGDAGTAFAQGGQPSNINDGNPTTREATFGPLEPVSYVGILWPTVRTVAVDRLDLTMATFYDGGWFGPNGVGPGAGGALTVSGGYLIEPTVQTTADGGVTWTTRAHTSNYLTAFEGHLIGGPSGQPTSQTATFTLTTPQANINGIRIIGQEGGQASGGFIGVFELKVQDVSSVPVCLTVHTGETITTNTSQTLDCLVIQDGGTFILGSAGPAPSAPILTTLAGNPPSIVLGSAPIQTAVASTPPTTVGNVTPSGPIPATESTSPPEGQGTYGGLLDSGTMGETKPGMATFTVNRNGRFTGSIRYEGRRYGLSGKFDRLGHYAGVARNQSHARLAVALSLDVADGSGQLTGTISDGSRKTAFSADRAAFAAKTSPNPQVGRYIVELLPGVSEEPSLPTASGLLRVQPSGSARLVGRLIDGTPFSFGGQLSKQGTLPFVSGGASAMIALPK